MADDAKEIFPYPGGRRKSRVWDTFGFVKYKEGPPTKHNLDMSRAVCRICRKSYVNKGNTTNFQFHLDHDHPHEFQKASNKQPKQAKVQPKINLFTEGDVSNPGRITTTRQSLIDGALMQLLVGKVLPLSLVDCPQFKTFVRLLDPRYCVPSRRQVVRSLEKKHAEVKEKLKSDLEDSESVSITHDGWTSLNTESFNTVTAHFIDRDWNMKSAVLETKKMEGSHTSEKIAAALKETEKCWSLKNPLATTDNAANEKKAFEILQWTRFGCYGHRLNLVVRNALSVPLVSRILGKGRSLVTFFHSSSSITDELMNKQRLTLNDDKVGHKLIMDVATHWNSTLAMLQRLCEQTPAIMALAHDESISKTASAKIRACAYSFEEHTMIERMVDILKPFEKATTILCAEKTPTMNKVLPIVVKLGRALIENPSDPPMIKAMMKQMATQLEMRTETEDLAVLACVLSPYTKDFGFLPEKKAQAHDMLRKLALELGDSVPVKVKIEKVENSQFGNDMPPLPSVPGLELNVDNPQSEPQDVAFGGSMETSPEEPPIKKIKSADTDDWLMDIVCIGETKENMENIVEQEVTRYLGSSVKAGDGNLTVLQWWKENECFYPRISRLAKKYLACQASSVASERVFSLAGALVNKKRARISSSNVDMMIFMNKNMELYW